MYKVKDEFISDMIVSEIPCIHDKEEFNRRIDALFTKPILSDEREYYLNHFEFNDENLILKDDASRKEIFEARHQYANTRIREAQGLVAKIKIAYFIFMNYSDNKHLVVYASYLKGLMPDIRVIRDGNRNNDFNISTIALVSDMFLSKESCFDLSLINVLGRLLLCPVYNEKTNTTTGFKTDLTFRNDNIVFNLGLTKRRGGNPVDLISVMSSDSRKMRLTKTEKKRPNITTNENEFQKSRHHAYMVEYNSLIRVLEFIGIISHERLESSYFRNEYLFSDFVKKEDKLKNITIVYSQEDYNLLSNDNKFHFNNFINEYIFTMLKETEYADYPIDICTVKDIVDVVSKIDTPTIYIDLSETVFLQQIEDGKEVPEYNNIFVKDNNQYHAQKKHVYALDIIRQDKFIQDAMNGNFEKVFELVKQYDLYTQIKVYNLLAYQSNMTPLITQNVKFDKIMDEYFLWINPAKKKNTKINIMNKILSELYIKNIMHDENFTKRISNGPFKHVTYVYVHNYSGGKNNQDSILAYYAIDMETSKTSYGWSLINNVVTKQKLGISQINTDISGYYLIFDKKDYIYTPEQSKLPHMIINKANINTNLIENGDISRSLATIDTPLYGLFYPTYKKMIDEKISNTKAGCFIDFKEKDMWIYFNYNISIKSQENFISLDSLQFYKKVNDRMPPMHVDIKQYPEHYQYYLKNITYNIIRQDNVSKSNIFFKFIHNILS